MVQLIRRHPVISFYVLAFGLASLVGAGRYIVAVALAGDAPEQINFYAIIWEVQERLGIENINVWTLLRMSFEEPAVGFALPYAAAPSIAAIVIALIISGRAGCIQLLHRFRPWREGVTWREGLRVYGVIVALFMGFTVYFALVSWIHGGDAALDEIGPRFGSSLWLFLLLFLVGAFLREGGLLEELGWRGFALPRLMDGMRSPLNASILLGILWSCWHIPRDVASYMISLPAGEYILFLVVFTVSLIGLSIVITYFFNRTGGSVIPAIMIHCLYVHMSSGLAYETLSWTDFGDFRSWIVLLLAFVILWKAGPELGRRPAAGASAALD